MDRFASLFGPYVRFGSRNLYLTYPRLRGTDVAVLQGVYNVMHEVMTPPIGDPVPLTGEFDANTMTAVQNVERQFGLAQDGVAGPNVFFAYGQGVPPFTTYGGPVFGIRELSQGDSGGDVKILQNRLNLFRYASQVGAPADGIFGPKTAAAALTFKQDAIANGNTGLTYNSVVGSGAYDSLWIYTFVGGRAIQSGRNGFDVVFLQVLLQNLGYYSGARNGLYDATTKAAVVAFQQAHHLSADGVVGPATFYALGQHNPNTAPFPLPVLHF